MKTGRAKLAYMFLSILISTVLWFYVVGIENPGKEQMIRDIPVTFRGEEEMLEDRSLVLVEGRPTVNLRFSGRMFELASLDKQRDEITATVDLSNITSPGSYRLPYDVNFPVDKVTIIERTPAYYIDVRIERVYSANVEIRVKNQGSVAAGYIASEPVFDPELLQVTGPEDVTSRIAYAQVVWNRVNIERTITADLEFTLHDEYGLDIPKDQLVFSRDLITVTMTVMKTKELPLQVEVIPGGGAEPRHISHRIEPRTITVAGPVATIDALNSLVVGTLDLSKIINSGKIEYSIVLPNEVVSLSGEVNCEVEIEITGLMTRTVECTNIEVVGKSEGMDIEILTRELPALVRGNSESVGLVYGHNLRAVADISGMSFSLGRYSIPVTVYLDGFTDVGVVGEYKVAIDVLKIS